MNVLSLFDGMSCGQIALERAGITVDNYYASEIDKHCITVTQTNYPETIQLGDVSKIDGKDLPNIDLLIGGSPCQGFSFIGKGLNFDDPRSKLFFEYVRLLKECNPTYFMLENVRMKKELQDIISKYLGVDPVVINSNLVSAQNRHRLYWTNIDKIEQPIDKCIYAQDIQVDENKNKFPSTIAWKNKRKFIKTQQDNKMPAMTTYCKSPNGLGRPFWSETEFYMDYPFDYTKISRLDVIEAERLQTVPENYTNYVSNAQRYKMLGNGWTVDVIAHIFKNMETPKK